MRRHRTLGGRHVVGGPGQAKEDGSGKADAPTGSQSAGEGGKQKEEKGA